MNSVKLPGSPWLLVAQWIERPPKVRDVIGSIPVGDSDFFFVPRSCHVDQFIFHILLPSLQVKFTIFIRLSIIILSSYARYLLTNIIITVSKLTFMTCAFLDVIVINSNLQNITHKYGTFLRYTKVW